jgi:hypothetical protein
MANPYFRIAGNGQSICLRGQKRALSWWEELVVFSSGVFFDVGVILHSASPYNDFGRIAFNSLPFSPKADLLRCGFRI